MNGDPTQLELKLVQVVFRHGARTPLKSIPDVLEADWVPDLLKVPAHTQIDYVVTDLEGGPRPSAPVEDGYRVTKLHGGTYPGQLTSLGMQQLYDLGMRLRRSYIMDLPFLTASFSAAEVYVRSTNIMRTIESAKCLVAGLYQQKQDDAVPILTTDTENEILYPNYHGCKLLKVLIGRQWAELFQLPDITADLKSIQAALGIQTEQRLDFIHLRDNMVAREAHGLPCPAGLEMWRSTVERRAVQMICHIYGVSREHLQLSIGPFLQVLLTNIEDRLKGTGSAQSRKLFLYSVHDTTLMPCLMALGIFDAKWPPYAADLVLELYQHCETQEAFVKVSYLGQDKLIPGCSGVYCPLQEFQGILSNFSLTLDRYHILCNQADL
ncbi:lysophosphatidic acid phosphatase type 6 [Brienomyrus brachyistius]|uniref:lysophosphatidic acid phosphatase type 6 n=1 Tax=Brienomyrus brachyistius TaxID=42636 RepID=UPI0020B321D8|nr:lysophosphatidic acid phosphatase type 6 [Brienomyrus brachyistius]